ncbi:ribonuclease inhibitor-like [Triplophysa rosa]|uniref:ribonuclease inhibitor-like n=1 Tax=Triplophysa rosa TaxID=992332 RepID=UPI0025463456|nr:ribonuclease inhibitor-like [Triplophysa rosa]
MDSHSKVETIRLNNCELTEKQCSAVAAVLSCKTLVREMNLNNSRLLDSGLKHICDKLKNPQCQLHILKLSECSITGRGYRCLSEAVRSNPSHLISLDLTGNDPGPSGVKLIHQLIQDTNCALNTVRVHQKKGFIQTKTANGTQNNTTNSAPSRIGRAIKKSLQELQTESSTSTLNMDQPLTTFFLGEV